MKLTLLFSFLFSVQVFAAGSCNEVNLISEANSPFLKIPVCDQEMSTMCYACAAANLVDFHLIKNGSTGQQIHPVWAAFLQSNARNRRNFDGGWINETIEALINERNCPYALVTEQLRTICEQLGIAEAEVFSLLDLYEQTLPWLIKTKEAQIKKKCTFKQLQELQKKAFSEVLRMLKMEKRVKKQSLKDLQKITPDLNSMNVFLQLTRNACAPPRRDQIKLPHPTLIELDKKNASSANLQLGLKLRLTEKNPVVISFCKNIFLEENYASHPRRVGNDWVVNSDCEPHVATVVGQKEIGNQCHYLLRNTWGVGWWDQPAVSKCLCRSTDKVTNQLIFSDCTKEDFDKGGMIVEACWLPEKRVMDNSIDFTSIDIPKKRRR